MRDAGILEPKTSCIHTELGRVQLCIQGLKVICMQIQRNNKAA